jgi:hypothetical protein
LVTLRGTEAFPLFLLRDQPSGKWIFVEKVCKDSGIEVTGPVPEVVAAWLPDPFGDQDYAVIIFYDVESMHSFAAHYNRRRLLDSHRTASE